MRVVIGDRFRRWSSSSIAFRRWVTGILLVTHDSSVRPSPHSPRNRRQFLAREASAAVGGFVHPHITPCGAATCALLSEDPRTREQYLQNVNLIWDSRRRLLAVS